MNAVRFCIMFLVAAALPLVVQAEVYKWKDKDGTVRYSDTPPTSNIKTETLVKKKAVSAPAAPAINPPTSTKIVTPPQTVVVPERPDVAAQKRRDEAELDKKNKLAKEEEARRKAENCIAAKSNMEAYTQGGRVFRTNEKGERVWMDDNAFEQGRQKAQQEIDENC